MAKSVGLIAIWTCTFLIPSCSPSASDPLPPRNLLLVTLDTTRADHLGCYGGDPRVSPTIDALSHKGVTFDRAYTTVPYTLPAHTTLMTGELPITHGIRTNALYRVPTSAYTLAEHLQDAGYHTAAFPSAEVLLREQGLDQGFDVYADDLGQGMELPLPMRSADKTAEFVSSWIQEELQEPFFAWIHFFDPHSPYEEPPGLQGKFSSAYDAEIHFADQTLGRILTELDQANVMSKTVVCITADHGESLGEHREDSHGYFLYESTMRIPLILTAPALSPQRIATPVGLESVASTLLELIHVAPLGEDAPAALNLEGDASRETPVYLETYVPYLSFGWSPMEAVVDGNWKYIHAPEPELYDLDADPREQVNHYNRQGERAAMMRQQLEAIRNESSQRLGQELVELDEDARSRLAELGYVTAPPSAIARGELPRPGAAAGPDPKRRREVLPLIQKLFTAGALNKGNEIFALCDQILRWDPQNPIAFEYRGTELVRVGRYREALIPLQKMDEMGRATPKALMTLGLAHFHLNDMTAAANALERSLSRSPDNPRTLRWLGEVEERRNNPDRALRLYERLLEGFRGPDQARRQIESKVRKLSDAADSPPP